MLAMFKIIIAIKKNLLIGSLSALAFFVPLPGGIDEQIIAREIIVALVRSGTYLVFFWVLDFLLRRFWKRKVKFRKMVRKYWKRITFGAASKLSFQSKKQKDDKGSI